MKHTKGEWNYDFQNKHIIDSMGNTVPMPDRFCCSPRTEEETFGHLEEWQEAQANIKLITASPDLLAALEEVARELEYALRNHALGQGCSMEALDRYIINHKTLNLAKATIQKATT